MVLHEIRQWHDHLRSIVRRTDTVTVLILDLIDKHILGQKPSERSTSHELAAKIESSMVKAQKSYWAHCEQEGIKEPSPRFREALLAAQQSAQHYTSSPLPSACISTLFPPPEAGNRYKSSTRVRKSAKMSRVSHISQAPSAHLMGMAARPAQSSPPLDDSKSIYASSLLRASPEFELDADFDQQKHHDADAPLDPQQGHPGIAISQAEPNSDGAMRARAGSSQIEPLTGGIASTPRSPHPIPVPRQGKQETFAPTSPPSTEVPLESEYTYAPPGILSGEASSAKVAPFTGTLSIPKTCPSTAATLPSLQSPPGMVVDINKSTAAASLRIHESWPICEELEKLTQEEKGIIPRLFGLPKDGFLENFLKDRDIVSPGGVSATCLTGTT